MPEQGSIPRTCEQCGARFSVYPAIVKRGGGRFCSKGCANRNRAKPIMQTCPVCGIPFRVVPSKIKTRIHCSRECTTTSNKRKWASGEIQRHRRITPNEFICAQCGDPFSRFYATDCKYCSQACQQAAKRKERVALTCVQCGEPFTVEPSVARINKPKFCSFACQSKSREKGADTTGLNKRSERTVLMQRAEYIAWRIAVFERDEYTCQMCGTQKPQFNAHHIKSFKSHPVLRFDVNNGQTLCVPCHRALHKRIGKK